MLHTDSKVYSPVTDKVSLKFIASSLGMKVFFEAGAVDRDISAFVRNRNQRKTEISRSSYGKG